MNSLLGTQILLTELQVDTHPDVSIYAHTRRNGAEPLTCIRIAEGKLVDLNIMLKVKGREERDEREDETAQT